MRLFIGTIALSLTALISSAAHAATVVTDDASFGTGTVLRDTTNNRDFLRLDLTMGYGYAGVLAQLGVGGDFAGWSVASTAVMQDLGTSAGVTHGSTDVAQITIAENLRDFFCPSGTCVNVSSTHTVVRGLVSDMTLSAGNQDAFSIGRRFNVTPNEVDWRISGFGFPLATNEEVWLTRTSAVPLPAPVLLLMGGLFGLGAVARRKSA